ncbi:MAG: hypothetical protein M3Z04_06560 [Chloroflexota bacterium]|nr:hypothetical protein [Chloroflexota bacterium]
MSIIPQVYTFLQQLEAREIKVFQAGAYDTAWLAALRDSADDSTAHPLFPQSLEWLTTHQHADGSWGAPWPYYHDRLLSTLRAVLTLHSWGRRTADKRQIDLGLGYIWRNAGRQHSDPWETVGFELIFPTLLEQAEQAGLALPYAAFADLQTLRRAKLELIPPHLAYSRHTSLAMSLEMLGDTCDPNRLSEAQEANGGVSFSPSATAYVLQHDPNNGTAYRYLQELTQGEAADGSVPVAYPLEIFDESWSLRHLQHAVPQRDPGLIALMEPLAQRLNSEGTLSGWTSSAAVPVKESDTTGVCFAALSYLGYELDPELLYQYEEPGHFRCYPFERNPSISANIHVLDALHYCDPRESRSRITKVIRFLRATRNSGGYWFDKWQVSPYYTTGHSVMAAHDIAPDLVEPAIQWMIHTQWADGSWGWFAPTLEETAYVVLAMLVWQRSGHAVPAGLIERGVEYLRRGFSPTAMDYPPLWICKTLFTPVRVVHGLLLATLLGCEAAGY